MNTVKKQVNRKIKGEYTKVGDTSKYNLRPIKSIVSNKQYATGEAYCLNVIGQGTKFIGINEYDNILKNGYNMNKIINDIITISFDVKNKSKKLIDIIGYVISKYNGLIVKNGKDYSFKIALKPSALKKVVRSLYKVYGVKSYTIRNNDICMTKAIYINSEATLQSELMDLVKN